MDPTRYRYDSPERQSRSYLSTDPAIEPVSLGPPYSQLLHQSENFYTPTSAPDSLGYQLLPIRGFDLSHLRQQNSSPQYIETRTPFSSPGTFENSRGPRLRRLAPSIGTHTLIRPTDNFGLPRITVDSQLLLPPPQPPRLPLLLPSLRDYDQRQRPTDMQLSNVQTPFNFRPFQPLSHLACVYPFSNPPPTRPRDTCASVLNFPKVKSS